ncbi:MAG: 5-(carboxyamino)imidazole ribonucleotide mutase [Gammaproteobacteria bacterium]|nr:5-(carboxyamino)imidazole ribonucleotide mutase [Gammaproteobacteria bacterium]NIR98389.1 5-(carboxyamino)imidazole ribonucleotide mutase [Gammaproteobacteria bacterium]NIT64143.1 5-(carboxyamino)imidazole ribonucleotide mutase [Gammaproteobacteria bacterium]NIV21080.1 5-(carboxyamino)imidazole ribonucleotide mutase [Gammaproteobacteria bacterium]NIY32723.1 5-(carboxyamino)imidazole ribonucleotide mutase [Gammaproteobacteria bacterium]
MSKPFVAILMGSDSDLPAMQATMDVLESLDVPYEVKITSAHRTPEATHAYVKDAEQRGCAVFIAAAGLAAHLAGTVAALTLRPVIGVPLDAGPLSGIDSLLSTVQMPGGIPVACVAVGKAGAKNAAYLAAQILANSDSTLARRLRRNRDANAEQVLTKDADLQERLQRRE